MWVAADWTAVMLAPPVDGGGGGSAWHVALHPSPAVVLPSSQVSPASMSPFPQMGVVLPPPPVLPPVLPPELPALPPVLPALPPVLPVLPEGEATPASDPEPEPVGQPSVKTHARAIARRGRKRRPGWGERLRIIIRLNPVGALAGSMVQASNARHGETVTCATVLGDFRSACRIRSARSALVALNRGSVPRAARRPLRTPRRCRR